MQELYVYGGQFDNYKNSSEWLSKCLQIGVNQSQMERLTQYYGGLLETEIEASLTVSTAIEKKAETRGRKKKQKEGVKGLKNKEKPIEVISDKATVPDIEQVGEKGLPIIMKVAEGLELLKPLNSFTTGLSVVQGDKQVEKAPPPVVVAKEETALQKAAESMKKGLKKEEIVYAMVDGSMLPTREGEDKNDWREVKVGRIFTQSSIHEVDKNHNWIRQSLYVARMDNHLIFIQVMFMALNHFKDLGKNLVFINDGASWIWKWIDKVFSNSTQILDFFHVMEYLSKSANILFKDKAQCKTWIEKQETALMQDGVEAFIKELEQLMLDTKMTKTQIKEMVKIIKYFKKHQKRMMYKTFVDRGLLIGSGPIESAHRVILQKRLKQSGQRWSKKGAQNVINLRIQQSNGLWNNVVNLIDKKNNTKFANAA
jgi:hypothetical protein